jgi:hypothetical protein
MTSDHVIEQLLKTVPVEVQQRAKKRMKTE